MFAFLKNLFRRKKPEPVVDPVTHFGDEKKCPFLHPPAPVDPLSELKACTQQMVEKHQAALLAAQAGSKQVSQEVVLDYAKLRTSVSNAPASASPPSAYEQRRRTAEDARRRTRDDEAEQERQRHSLWLSMPDDPPARHYSTPHYSAPSAPCEPTESPSYSNYSSSPSYQCDAPSYSSPSYDSPSYDNSPSYNSD